MLPLVGPAIRTPVLDRAALASSGSRISMLPPAALALNNNSLRNFECRANLPDDSCEGDTTLLRRYQLRNSPHRCSSSSFPILKQDKLGPLCIVGAPRPYFPELIGTN